MSRPDLRTLLHELGFTWINSKYRAHLDSEPGQEPDAKILDSIDAAQQSAQPFRYPDGLIDIPMSPISDINAFRTRRWKPVGSYSECGTAPRSVRPMFPPDALQWLRCPIDPQRQAALVDAETHLACERCQVRFRIRDGIPNLIADEAELPEGRVDRRHLPCLQ